MPPSKEFLKMLEKMKEIHISKNHDYSSKDNPFSNFEISAIMVSWFKNDDDKAFVALIGTKLARLSSLLNSGNLPNNEAIEDSFIDMANYVLLWGASKK